ncbi:Tm-1-like ATP-binding domain-containing protein [Streptomyces specialis]|uniref:Tm-1-like ATP-binding domain-containing protein n=1 Tax=Streptomyces specialis TaxID=498367 RepID=UPI00073E971D|nr:Tm-1-like ATP-binding domain-containing protein [Streptomyces specialis]
MPEPGASPVALLAALEAEADDAALIRARLRANGHEVTLVDIGVTGEPHIEADIGRSETAAAGGPAGVVRALVTSGRARGVLAVGGAAAAAVGRVMTRPLPPGVPVVVVSAPARKAVRGRGVRACTRAADALSGMVAGFRGGADGGAGRHRPLVVATVADETAVCVAAAREHLAGAGCEVLLFRAAVAGGRAMERLVAEGYADAVLDLTTRGLVDEVVGGAGGSGTGPRRLEAAAARGVPQVVSPGGTDAVAFGPDGVPERFAGRLSHRRGEGARTTLVRVTAEEAMRVGAVLAARLNGSHAPATLLLPLRGVSALDAPGRPFHEPVAGRSFAAAVRRHVDRRRVRVAELDLHLNDEEFARAAADHLLGLLTDAGRLPRTERAGAGAADR